MKAFLSSHRRGIALALILLGLYWLWGDGTPRQHPAPAILPDSVQIYVEMPDCHRFLIALPEMPFWSNTKSADRAARHVQDDLLSLVSPMFGNPPLADMRVFFSYAHSLSIAQMEMPQETWVMVLATSNPESLEEMLDEAFSLHGKSHEVEETPVHVWTLPRGSERLWSLCLDGALVLVWAVEQDMVRHIIQTKKGIMVPLQAGHEFERRRQQLPQDTALWLYTAAERTLARKAITPNTTERPIWQQTLLGRIDMISLSVRQQEHELVVRGEASLFKPFQGVFPVFSAQPVVIPNVNAAAWATLDIPIDVSEALHSAKGDLTPPRDARHALSILDTAMGTHLEPMYPYWNGVVRLITWREKNQRHTILTTIPPQTTSLDNIRAELSKGVGITVTPVEHTDTPMLCISQYDTLDLYLTLRDGVLFMGDNPTSLAHAHRHFTSSPDAPLPGRSALGSNANPPLICGSLWPGRLPDTSLGGLAALIDPEMKCDIVLTGDANALRMRSRIHPASNRLPAPARGHGLFWWICVTPFIIIAFVAGAFLVMMTLFALRYWLEARQRGIVYQKIVPTPHPLPNDVDALLAPRRQKIPSANDSGDPNEHS